MRDADGTTVKVGDIMIDEDDDIIEGTAREVLEVGDDWCIVQFTGGARHTYLNSESFMQIIGSRVVCSIEDLRFNI